jgi:citrate lyase subunit beta / citryl-CoA lyase
MEFQYDRSITKRAGERNRTLLKTYDANRAHMDPKYRVQYAHLTVPATNMKYIEGAAKSKANLIMLDLEDSIPRGNDALLQQGRANIVEGYRKLDWGNKIRYFRPRGLALDPDFEDIACVVSAAGEVIDGLIFPKIESPDEVRSIDSVLSDLEEAHGLPHGKLTFQVLIESANAESLIYEIAQASKRLTALIFGAFDYWGSLGLLPHLYRADHPMINDVRCRVVKAAASVGIPAIAEMTLNYPTKEKTEAEKQAAIEECRRDALLAFEFGFAGKWTGIPAQTDIALAVFAITQERVDRAVRDVRLFLQAEAEGKGAVMIDGKMADRATDRINRALLKQAFERGQVELSLMREFGLLP